MDGFPCHQDVQLTSGEVLLLQYVSKYVSKFSDSNCDEWLNDEASADSVAWLDPEMILQLAGAALSPVAVRHSARWQARSRRTGRRGNCRGRGIHEVYVADR